MDDESLSPSDLERFHEMLGEGIVGARSVEDVEAWLAAQPYVSFVRVGDYLLKSYPPQRHVTVALRVADGGTAVKVINIAELGDGEVRLEGVSDA